MGLELLYSEHQRGETLINKNEFVMWSSAVSVASLLFFNNCSQKLSSAALASNEVVNFEAAAHVESTLAAASDYKVFTAQDLSGPWTENGNLCRGQIGFVKTTGPLAGLAVKGCASPSAGTGCLDLTKHRVFTSDETASGNIITKLAAADSNNYPVGEYSFFLSFWTEKRIALEKVGVARIINCGATSPPVCAWQIINPQPVIGGGNNVYPTLACSSTTAGTKGSGYYDMGSNNHINQQYECQCK